MNIDIYNFINSIYNFIKTLISILYKLIPFLEKYLSDNDLIYDLDVILETLENSLN